MKIGLYGIGNGYLAEPDTVLAVSQAAEAAGFDSIWTGEHVVVPDPRVPPSPIDPDFPMLHPSTTLSYVAAATTKLLLGTGIILVPQRNPVVLAKELASLDVLSKGRLLFGIGVGYLQPEFEGLGVPFEDRGARTDEYIEAMKALWTMDKPAFKGRFVEFDGINAYPRPVQTPHPPVIVGGMSEPAYRRAVRRAQGWYGYALDVEGTRRSITALRAIEGRGERPKELGALEISVTPFVDLDRDTVKAFEDMGVDRIVARTKGKTKDRLLAYVDRLAEAIL